jgi:hypothetical protein
VRSRTAAWSTLRARCTAWPNRAARDGGSGGCGTIFGLSKSGAFQAVYSFQGPPNDGAFPWGNLTNVKGVLYGTTDQGGASTACSTASRTPPVAGRSSASPRLAKNGCSIASGVARTAIILTRLCFI